MDTQVYHNGTFSGPTTEILTFSAMLFDMDGTLVDSTDAIIKHWHKIGKELGVDPNVVLQSSHGRRSIETLKLYDPSKANWEYVSFVEGSIPREFGAKASLVPGARFILSSLQSMNARWAIVTSGSRALVEGWLDCMELARPEHMVVAEDVENGKPDPECYLLAKKRLDLAITSPACVIEDSSAGVMSGRRSNCRVLGLATTHSPQQLLEAGADWVVRDLRDVELVDVGRNATGEVKLKICKTFQTA